MAKIKEFCYLVEEVELKKVYVCETLTGIADGLGVSAQAVYNALNREGMISKRYRVRKGRRFYVVKTKGSDYRLCRYDESGERFVEVGESGGAVPARSVAGVRDVTVCMMNAGFVGGFGFKVGADDTPEEGFVE